MADRRPTDIQRNAYARFNRIIALRMQFEAWRKQVNCVEIDHDEFKRMFSVSTLNQSRVDWFCEDVAFLFPRHFRFESPSGSVTHFFHRSPASVKLKELRYGSMGKKPACKTLRADKKLFPVYDEGELTMHMVRFSLGIEGPWIDYAPPSLSSKYGKKRPTKKKAAKKRR